MAQPAPDYMLIRWEYDIDPIEEGCAPRWLLEAYKNTSRDPEGGLASYSDNSSNPDAEVRNLNFLVNLFGRETIPAQGFALILPQRNQLYTPSFDSKLADPPQTRQQNWTQRYQTPNWGPIDLEGLLTDTNKGKLVVCDAGKGYHICQHLFRANPKRWEDLGYDSMEEYYNFTNEQARKAAPYRVGAIEENTTAEIANPQISIPKQKTLSKELGEDSTAKTTSRSQASQDWIHGEIVKNNIAKKKKIDALHDQGQGQLPL